MHKEIREYRSEGGQPEFSVKESESVTDWLSSYVAWQHSHWPVCIEETSLSVKLLEEKGHVIKEKKTQE